MSNKHGKPKQGVYLELDTTTNGCVLGHSRGRWQWNGMQNRNDFYFSWAALLYALWIGSRMVLDDVVFYP
jgi:hypothetical protein